MRWFVKRTFCSFGIGLGCFFGRCFFGRSAHHGTNGLCFSQGLVATQIQIAFACSLISNNGFGFLIGLLFGGLLERYFFSNFCRFDVGALGFCGYCNIGIYWL